MSDGSRKNILWDLLEDIQSLEGGALRSSFARHMEYTVGKYKHNINNVDVYQALAFTLRDILIDRWNSIQELYAKRKAKRVYYISIEFLIGNLLDVQLRNLQLHERIDDMLREMGFDLDTIVRYEPDAGLGNGGLGRLAACFLDSLATMNYPATGCSLRYEYGMFHQMIVHGEQREAPDNWLTRGNPWELKRSDRRFPVHFYGRVTRSDQTDGRSPSVWEPGETVFSMPSDILLGGYATNTVTNLRLWRAASYTEFNLNYFHHGNYIQALEDSLHSEYLTKILYPGDSVIQGRELRLKQEYFLVAATLKDALRTLEEEGESVEKLAERAVFQLNDTHPALAVAELMRLLIDVHQLSWEQSWDIVRRCFAYTNHTVLPEALEMWETDLFARVLPRHMEIVYLINYDFIEEIRSMGGPLESLRHLSIIEEEGSKRIKMANLALVGSSKVNGVSALHSEIIKTRLFRDYYRLHPEKFTNKTNGIAHRRWLLSANPKLSQLISSKIGTDWILNLEKLSDIEEFIDNADFLNDWEIARRHNKEALARIIQFETGFKLNIDAMFDVHVKRIHEYKRQLLNVLRILGDYLRLREDSSIDYAPRVIIFAGKAAPGYRRAKLIIRLIHAVGALINGDERTKELIRVIFLPDFQVSLAERIYPAADLSEQISTAGTEASGTGNMKFMLNGALTIGTLDGANIEMQEEVGAENMYIFGNTTTSLEELARNGYEPAALLSGDAELQQILDCIDTGLGHAADTFRDVRSMLLDEGDCYYHLADYRPYMAMQERIAQDYKDRNSWYRKSILNTARCGKFSSDRTIREYADEIWKVEPIRPD